MHSLMTPQMVGYEVRFYDWADDQEYGWIC